MAPRCATKERSRAPHPRDSETLRSRPHAAQMDRAICSRTAMNAGQPARLEDRSAEQPTTNVGVVGQAEPVRDFSLLRASSRRKS